MNVWIIEPRDPLIVRDGRPFGPVPGARAESLAFPFPSTTTGGVRTLDGLDADGRFQPKEIPRIKLISVKGPFLIELGKHGEILDWLLPAPADALLLETETCDGSSAQLKALVPIQAPPGARTDLAGDLALVGMPRADRRKPYGRAPRYWRWPCFERWLLDSRDQRVTLDDLGHDGPVMETRIHVGIQSETKTAGEGALFQTRGLEFAHAPVRSAMSGAKRLGLAVATDAPNLKLGVTPFGGERRLAHWRPSDKKLPILPEELRKKIAAEHHCRLLLLTPAHFLAGWQPAWLMETRQGVTPSLQAVAVRRPMVVSGWDMDANKGKGQPKPTRCLAPAGTVFYLNLQGDSAVIEEWVEAIWMHCVSDEEQDRCDGFGVAVLGAWDGNFQRMEV